MGSDIQKIAVVDGRVRIVAVDRQSRQETVITPTQASAEIWAHDILDAVKQLDRARLDEMIASIRRQAQQLQVSLDRMTAARAELDAPDLASMRVVHIRGDFTPGEKWSPDISLAGRAGPADRAGLAAPAGPPTGLASVVIMPEVSA